jgi:hypothetical protein
MRSTWRTAVGTGVVVLALVTGCSSEPPPGPTKVVEFSATGSGPAAYGRYAIIGELNSTNLRTFEALPFSQSIITSPDAAPKMSVALADARLGSRVSCRIAVDGRVLATATATGTGQAANCSVPPGSIR